MARINTKNLTVDFSNLRKLSMSDRLAMLKSERGRDYLSSLTPVEYAMLFPDYFRKRLPDLGKTATPTKLGFFGQMGRAITGGPSYGGAAPSAPARPGTAAPSAPPSTKASTPAASSDTKFGWEKRLEELAKKYQVSVTPSIANKSIENLPTPEMTRRIIIDTAKKRGWTKEGTAALLGMTRQESSFNPYTIGDGGRSFGIFQVANSFGSAGKESRLDRFVSIAKSKTGIDNPLQYIRDVKSGKIKPDPKITQALIESSIEHFVDNDVDTKINNNNVKAALSSNNISKSTEYLLRATRPLNWNQQGKSGWEWSKRLKNSQNELSGVKSALEEASTATPGDPSKTGSTQQARVEGPRERVLGKDEPPPVASDYMSIANERLKNFPESFKKQLEELPEDQRNKFLQQIASIPDDKLPEFSKYLQSLPVPEQREIIPQITESAPGEIPNLINGVIETQQNVAGIRRLPLKDELKEYYNYATKKTGIKFEVSSGGQTKEHRVRGSSHRHNVDVKGTYGAGDGRLFIENKDGSKRYLSIYRKEDLPLIQSYVKAFASVAPGAGIGAGYMGKTKKDRGELIHIGGPNYEGGPPKNYSGQRYIGEAFKAGRSLYGTDTTRGEFNNFLESQQRARLEAQRRTEPQPEQTAPAAPAAPANQQPNQVADANVPIRPTSTAKATPVAAGATPAGATATPATSATPAAAAGATPAGATATAATAETAAPATTETAAPATAAPAPEGATATEAAPTEKSLYTGGTVKVKGLFAGASDIPVQEGTTTGSLTGNTEQILNVPTENTAPGPSNDINKLAENVNYSAKNEYVTASVTPAQRATEVTGKIQEETTVSSSKEYAEDYSKRLENIETSIQEVAKRVATAPPSGHNPNLPSVHDEYTQTGNNMTESYLRALAQYSSTSMSPAYKHRSYGDTTVSS